MRQVPLIASIFYEETKPREVQWHSRGHTASRWQSWDLNLSILAPGSVLSTTVGVSLFYLQPLTVWGRSVLLFSFGFDFPSLPGNRTCLILVPVV